MGKKLMILFGTETGNAEMLAEDAGSSATDAGFEVEVRGMDEIDVDEMCEVERLLIYCSCLLYTSPSPRDRSISRMPSSA